MSPRGCRREQEQDCSGNTDCLGPIVAVLLSVHLNGWTWWAVLHAVLGWVYVAYAVIFKIMGGSGS